MDRDDAIALCNEVLADLPWGARPSYYSEPFTPDEWVIEAVLLSAHRSDELKATLVEANGHCRTAFQVANRIATEMGTHALQTNFGAFAEQLLKTLKRQHDVILKNGGYPTTENTHG